MKIKSKAARYLLWGMALDVAIVLGLILLTILSARISYDGKCPTIIMLDNGYTTCSFWQYLQLNFLFTVMAALLFWWITLPALLLPPLLGFAVGYYKSRAGSQTDSPHATGIFG
jgi:hypothetical protein